MNKILGLLLSAILFITVNAVPAHALKGVPSPAAAIAALTELREGNKRYVEDKSRHSGQGADDRKALTSGQKPPVIVLSCSDSRVPPELVFDQGLGRLFTVRVAGNILEPATDASIEYAVEHLGSSLILVMGHESCGAVKAALDTPAGKSAGSKDLDVLVGAVRTNLHGITVPEAESKTLRSAVKANVTTVAAALMKRSKIVREHVESGRLAIVPAIYGLESGAVEFWDTANLK